MTPKTQLSIGIVLLLLAVGAAVLQITQHQDVFSFVTIIFGAIGGQQIGQATSRQRR